MCICNNCRKYIYSVMPCTIFCDFQIVSTNVSKSNPRKAIFNIGFVGKKSCHKFLLMSINWLKSVKAIGSKSLKMSLLQNKSLATIIRNKSVATFQVNRIFLNGLILNKLFLRYFQICPYISSNPGS